ncbi:MAG: hypothetical protein WC732_09535 [Candidatus Omnitrophota bacterium]
MKNESLGESKDSLARVFRWDFFSFLIFLTVLLFQFSAWHRFPLFLDDYYHLSVLRGFSEAGGWVGEAFWEYAPVGRPHLYPPLWHILEWLLHSLGADLISVARLSNVLVYPFFLGSAWLLIRRQAGPRMAFWASFFLLSSESLYLAVINNIPFTLAFCFGLLAFYALLKDRPVSSCLALTAAFYTHSLMPWLFLGALLLWGALEKRRDVWKAVFAAFVLSLPILAHQARFLSFVRLVKPLDFYYLSFDPLLMLGALAGFWLSARRAGIFRFFRLLAGIFLFLMVTHRSRLLSGHGIVFFSFFAAAFVDFIWSKISVKVRPAALIAMVLIFQVFGPKISWDPEGSRARWTWADTPVMYWMGREPARAGIKAETIYYPKWIDECARLVVERSDPDDILYSNYDYGGGLVAVLAGRATSSAMLSEVRPFRDFDQIASAHWVLWFKDADGLSADALESVRRAYDLRKTDETEIAVLLSNPQASEKRSIKAARVPFVVCLAFLLAGAAAIFLEGWLWKRAR